MLFARHLTAVLSGLVVHALRTGKVGILLLVLLGGTVVAVTIVAQVIAPVAIYPFL